MASEDGVMVVSCLMPSLLMCQYSSSESLSDDDDDGRQHFKRECHDLEEEWGGVRSIPLEEDEVVVGNYVKLTVGSCCYFCLLWWGAGRRAAAGVPWPEWMLCLHVEEYLWFDWCCGLDVQKLQRQSDSTVWFSHTFNTLFTKYTLCWTFSLYLYVMAMANHLRSLVQALASNAQLAVKIEL